MAVNPKHHFSGNNPLVGMADIRAFRTRNWAGPSGKRISPNDVRIGIQTTGKRRPTVRLSIGTGVLERLRWSRGDKLSILFNDKMLYLRRSDEGTYRISLGGKNVTPHVTIPMFAGMPFSDFKGIIRAQQASWEYYDEGLLVALPDEPMPF